MRDTAATGGANDRLAAPPRILDTRTHNLFLPLVFTEDSITRKDDYMKSMKDQNGVDCLVQEVVPLPTVVNARIDVPIDTRTKAAVLAFFRELQTVVAAERAGPAFRGAE